MKTRARWFAAPMLPITHLAAALSLAVGVHALAPPTAIAGVLPVDGAFTYQGQLRTAGGPINGAASARFRLFNLAAGGSQIGSTITICDLDLVDGLFTVELDFGPTAFDGSARWLEIAVQAPAGNCATFTTLSPRQPITAAPYALRSLAPWEPNGSFLFYNGGFVGIGTDTPTTKLEVEAGDATLRVTSTAVNGTSTLDLKGDAPSGLTTNALGTIRFLDESNAVRASISSNLGFLASPFVFSSDGVSHMALTGTGNLGVGTTLPIARLQLVGGTDSEPSTGGFLVIGETNSSSLSMDNNEIMARNNGEVSTLFLNNDGGDISMCAGGGQVGIGTSPTSASLTVFNSLFVNGGAQPRIDVGPNGFILMDSGADITITNGGLEVNTPSGGSTFFNRTAPDGTLINFLNNGTFAGGIAVFGSTVSYNTFTGSHLGWTETPIAHGALVTLTGDNQRAHPGPNCEVVYGIAPSTMANDSRCLGAYLAAPDPDDASSRHLVASVGNGELWVVDSGLGDIEPGTSLISSDVAGCAMRDDPARFEVGHVIGRAAEGVRWSEVTPGADGTRRVLVSVFFDPFQRHGGTTELKQLVESLQAENAALRSRLDAIEGTLSAIAGATRATDGALAKGGAQ